MPGQHIIRVRQSSVRTFRACERRYDYAVNHRLVPKVRSPALSVGTFAHAGRAEWLRTFDAKKAVNAVFNAVHAETLLHPELLKVQPKLRKDGQHYADCRCITCLGLQAGEIVASYCTNWPVRFGTDIIVHAVEQQFEYELCSFEDLVLVYTGTCDADISFGPIRVNFEYKTTKLEFVDFFPIEKMSLQHTVYPYILEKEKGVPFHGTLLDATKKPTAERPAEHHHEIIPKTEAQFERFLYEQTELLKRLAYHIDKDYWPQNDMSCKTVYGKCPYLRICLTDGSRTAMNEYYVVDVPDFAVQLPETVSESDD